jgi:L-seryl-tRNA(Ser) seleniumtransferase
MQKLPEIINAAGPSTRFGGAPLDEPVIAAMAAAAACCYRIEDLQDEAGAFLAEITGAQAGYVTAGAAAGLVAAAAACMAGLDVAAMDRLPDTTGLKNEIVIQRGHVTAYSRCLRQSGARLVEVGYQGYPVQGITRPWQIESAINDKTAALAFAEGCGPGNVSLDEMAAIAKRHALPLIVDAAGAVKTAADLKRPIAAGADLAVFSGGKLIRGPQASGILVGRRDLIESAALQHLDLDVREKTWVWRSRLLESGRIAGIPNHGICRAMKVGKEQIAGLLAALQAFTGPAGAGDAAAQARRLERIAVQVREQTRAQVAMADAAASPRPYPTLLVSPCAHTRISDAADLIVALESGRPPIAVSHNFLDGNAVGIVAFSLKDRDVDYLASRLVALLAA